MTGLLQDPVRADRAAAVIECLAHPLRVRLVAALCAEEAGPGPLSVRLGVSASTARRHLEALARHGLIERIPGADPIAYRIAEPALHGLVACMESCSR